MISFWIVLERYVAFRGALSRCSLSVSLPLSIRNARRAWKFPWRRCSSGQSSLLLRRGSSLHQSSLLLHRFHDGFHLLTIGLTWACIRLFNCWSIGTTSFLITFVNSCMARTAEPCTSVFPDEWSWNLVEADFQNVSGDRNSILSLAPFLPDSIPKQTHGKQKFDGGHHFLV